MTIIYVLDCIQNKTGRVIICLVITPLCMKWNVQHSREQTDGLYVPGVDEMIIVYFLSIQKNLHTIQLQFCITDSNLKYFIVDN